ncbi:MAG: GntR family transcriptional regulator [Cyclobacteriaceae bacterium]|nr:GntR family transcriptional regulator [Cyclobacteriaceae bacterium]
MIKKENLEDFAYESILSLILESQYRPGDFLLETEITARLNLKSRTPVHHALGQLVAKGFLDKKSKKGCFIPPLSPEDAEHVFFARENIEFQAAASAALHASDEEIGSLQRIIQKEVETGEAGDITGYSVINESFHNFIAQISKNKYLQHYSQHIFWRSNCYVFFRYYQFKVSMAEREFRISPAQHMEITEAIAKRDADKAGKLMKQHVRRTFEGIFIE